MFFKLVALLSLIAVAYGGKFHYLIKDNETHNIYVYHSDFFNSTHNETFMINFRYYVDYLNEDIYSKNPWDMTNIYIDQFEYDLKVIAPDNDIFSGQKTDILIGQMQFGPSMDRVTNITTVVNDPQPYFTNCITFFTDKTVGISIDKGEDIYDVKNYSLVLEFKLHFSNNLTMIGNYFLISGTDNDLVMNMTQQFESTYNRTLFDAYTLTKDIEPEHEVQPHEESAALSHILKFLIFLAWAILMVVIVILCKLIVYPSYIKHFNNTGYFKLTKISNSDDTESLVYNIA